ncbi:acyl-CoA dehydrogenase [Arthrobacter sp. CAN_C5]|uniref:acyl-CoA dehydrogenase n=1 Tax=Arthrobacter sp. CAN_C5 TaxID=2760706 RepID=UPI001AE30AB3|nr:acyl-CoA dehydrogenase [Arthrobacter sp. CAN_C5]MBP2216724.1 alkylation response protein AidB-like acyl-CoA dehydrogenase [Arthrobacter sp. CAN_C5]
MTDLLQHFRPIFAEIAAGAVDRELRRELPFAEVELLKNAGFGALRIPSTHGGLGATLPQLFELLTELAAADSNLTQLWRGHFAYVEGVLLRDASTSRDAWLRDIAGGAMVGNASSELTGTSLRDISTTLTSTEAGLTLNGSKYYSTGALFADWIAGSAVHDGQRVGYAVSATAPGVDRIDDWDGIGQRLTGSGTTHFSEVAVASENVRPYTPGEPNHVPAFFQLVLVAALAGIARAAADDAASFVRPRTRSYVNATAALPREDPQVLAVLGELSSTSFAAAATVAAAARKLEAARWSLASGHPDDARAAVDAAEIAVSQAQIVSVSQVLNATSHLFEVGGASATAAGRSLDRHWRNARTVSSHNPAIYKARAVGYWAVTGTREPLPD